MSGVHLTILDVGHGNAAVLSGPDATVLIDSGPGPSVLSYLATERLAHLDAVAITHTDEDHLKGLAALIDSGVTSLGVVRINSDAAKQSRLWDSVAFSLDQLAKRQAVDFQLSLAEGDSLPEVAPGVRVEIVAPSRYLAARGPGSTDRAGRLLVGNSVSAVVRIYADGVPQVLLAADLDAVGLENMLPNQDLRTPVLVFPHHGGNVRSGASTQDNIDFTRRICAAVQPESVIFSLGRGRHATPRREIIQAVRESGARVRIACTQLSEACAASLPPAGAYQHLTALDARGKATGACCAGTIRIDLKGRVEPSAGSFHAFKARYVENAICENAL